MLLWCQRVRQDIAKPQGIIRKEYLGHRLGGGRSDRLKAQTVAELGEGGGDAFPLIKRIYKITTSTSTILKI